MRVLVTGATGYIGGRLVRRLLDAGHEVRVLVREASRVTGRPWAEQVEVAVGDLLKPQTLPAALSDIDAAFYLVHSMATPGDFERFDREAAQNFVNAAKHLQHVIYLGGLLPEGSDVSRHLASRAEVGRILRHGLATTEFRAGPIIGSGSASFEMLRYLTERLPVMITPRWIVNPVQPIAVRDVLAYLVAALEHSPLGVVDIGAEALTFRQMMLAYAELRGLRRWIMPVPVLAPRLAARWVGLVTPIPNRLAVPLIEGVSAPLIGDPTAARQHFPQITPIPYREAVQRALHRVEVGPIETRWSGATGRQTGVLSDWEGLIREVRTQWIDAPPEAVFRVFSGLGGDRGWLAWNRAWWVRGLIDRVIGGPGLRRGRRDADELLPGEAVDFWRVETIEPGRLLRLHAEMKVPGQAWLQFESIPEANGTRLVQTALFAPQGMPGAVYWYALYPLHRLIFTDLIRALAAEVKR